MPQLWSIKETGLWLRWLRRFRRKREKPANSLQEYSQSCLLQENPQSCLPQEHTQSCLLQLPVDVALLIVSRLPLPNQLILARTCRAMNSVVEAVILQQVGEHPPRQRLKIGSLLTRDQQLDYLYYIAHDSVDQWVCERCVAIHDVCVYDTPATALYTACPRGWDRLKNIDFVKITKSFSLKHSHVQTALKFARNWDSISNTQREYLRVLLMDKHIQPFMRTGFKYSNTEGKIDVWIQPRIVIERTSATSEPQYRFLLHTKRRGTPEAMKVLLKVRSMMSVCLHHSWEYAYRYRRSRQSPPSHGPANYKGTTVEPSNDDVEVMERSCWRCPTDYRIEVGYDSVCDQETATIWTWLDLGSEGSMTDTAWRVFEDWDGHPLMEDWNLIRKYYHVPGSVQELYERGERFHIVEDGQAISSDQDLARRLEALMGDVGGEL